MLSEGQSDKELIKSSLVIEENEILSLFLLFECVNTRAVLHPRICAEKYAECMSYHGVTRSNPFFLIFIVFLVVCHNISDSLKRCNCAKDICNFTRVAQKRFINEVNSIP